MQGKFKKAAAKKPYVSKTRKPRTTAEVAKLKAAVAKLNKISYDKVPMTRGFAGQTIGNLFASGAPFVYPIVNGFDGGMTPIWGYDTADIINPTKAYLNSVKVDVNIRQDNEPDLTTYTVFMVSLKDQGADATTFDPATGNLPALTDGVHYSQWSAADSRQVVVSPRFFNIHHTWRTFTGGQVGGQTVQPAIRSKSMSFVPKQKLYQNPRGNLFQNLSFAFSKDPSQNYFLLVFSNNATGDTEAPKLDVRCLYNWAIPS